METQTLDVDAEPFDSTEDEEETEQAWGRMFPLKSTFQSMDLVQERYVFGRDDECDCQFTLEQMKDRYQALSKKHFTLSRETTSTGVWTFLIDTSSNGTFVNENKVGKNKKQVLKNNDEISLAMKKNKVFIFIDLKAKDECSYPEELSSKYTMSRLLGRGACGEVKLAFAKGTCKSFAIKIVNKKKFTVGGKNQMNLGSSVMGEVKILKDLRHPCIIRIEDVIDTPDALYIVLELVEGGELFDRVVSVGQFDDKTAKLLFYQMVVAIKYLHEQGITHRDLKPENILLATDAQKTVIKVTDFGLSKFVDAGTMMKTFCGTPNYLAPEILLTHGSGSYTNKIDCWSLGVILYICLVGYPPFTDEREDMDLQKQILGGHYDFPPKYWSGVSADAIDLVKKLLQVDPRQRIALSEALNHPWLCDDEIKAEANVLMFGSASPEMLPPMKSAPPKRKLKSGAVPVSGDEPPNKRNGK